MMIWQHRRAALGHSDHVRPEEPWSPPPNVALMGYESLALYEHVVSARPEGRAAGSPLPTAPSERVSETNRAGEKVVSQTGRKTR